MNKKISTMFKELCCSECKCDFTDESIEIVREEEALFVIRLVCQNCGKGFGVAFLGASDLQFRSGAAHEPKLAGRDDYKMDEQDFDEDDMCLKMQDGPAPINIDDVLDAHKFIKNLDGDWRKYLPRE